MKPTPPMQTMRRWLGAALTLMLLPTSIQSADAQQVQLVSHRGESEDAPENTLASVNLAWERGIPGAEVDVYLTADGHLIAMHDANTRRTTGVDRQVRESTLAELQELEAGSWKGARWAGEPIPTLEQILRTVPDDRELFIEVKDDAEAIPAVERAIQLYARNPANMVIISFQADAVAESKRRMPELRAYYLSSFRRDADTGAWSPTVEELIERAQELNADALNLSANGPIDAEFVRKVKEAGLGMYVWTVNDPEVARCMIDAGVDGITTDRAAALREELGDQLSSAP